MPRNRGLGVKEAVLRSTWETPPPKERNDLGKLKLWK
jgi:hypothetical protein